MKKIVIVSIALLMVCNLFAQQENTKDFNYWYDQFIENQKTPLLKTDGEVFVLDGTAWERSYGEKEYVLTPVMHDKKDYQFRIREFDDLDKGIIKSRFHFIRIELTPLSRFILKSVNINVPEYKQDDVIAYLPEIDIAYSQDQNCNFKYLDDYGKMVMDKNNTNSLIENKYIIWYEDWEVNYFPGSLYSRGYWGSDCSWDDVNCESMPGGSWSLWCAGYGSACDPPCTEYVHDMGTWANNEPSPIGVNCYTNIVFTFWVKCNYIVSDICTSSNCWFTYS